MAGSVNKVILVGNLGRDPEARNMPSGGKVVSFSVATSEAWNDRASGERKEKTQWHRVAIFNERLGEIAEKYLRKGSKVYLEGSVETRKYTDKDGQERETTEIVLGRFRGELTLLDSRGGGGRRRFRRGRRWPFERRRRPRRRSRLLLGRRWRRQGRLGQAQGRRPGRRHSVLIRAPTRAAAVPAARFGCRPVSGPADEGAIAFRQGPEGLLGRRGRH